MSMTPAIADAVNTSASITGSVSNDGTPAPNVTVTATGNNVVLKTTTDDRGRFAFSQIGLGTYAVDAESGPLRGHISVDLGSGGAVVRVALSALHEIGNVSVARAAPVHGSGSDVSLNGVALARLPNGGSFPEMLVQLPGAVRGANGVVHLNGDHGVIDYQIDGVALPQGLNRDIGSELNLNDIAFADVIEGAYPAQYGLKFGSVLNLSTRSGTGPAGFDGDASGGSNSTFQQSFGYHTPLAGGGGATFAFGNSHTTRGLDPPNFGSPHDGESGSNQFARFTIPAGRNDFTNLTVIHRYGTFQIPNDVGGGEPAATDDNETQEDVLVGLQFRHALGSSGAVTFGPAIKVSRIRDFGDPAHDFAYGRAITVASGGSPTDCGSALSTRTYTVTTCGYSLADDRTSIDDIIQFDYSQQVGRHAVRAGVGWDGAKIAKRYAVTLQPGNFLGPIVNPKTPGAPTTVVDDDANIGSTYTSYAQDDWRLGDAYELDYGLRYDFFSITSTGFSQGFGGFSPRIKLTRSFGQRANVYAYVGRFFEPFSFENVGPSAAQHLNLPLQASVAQFDLKPERDTQVELGGHLPLGAGSLGFRIWQKNANDLIDDTQVGVTLLHQDINYAIGRLSQEALTYVQPLALNGRVYASLAHTVSLNKGCETQLLAPCFGSPTDFTPADHDQSYSAAGGVLINDRRGGWFSADGEYGSGLSSGSCPSGTRGNCKRTPHAVFAVEKGIAVGRQVALTLGIANLLNDRYYVTLLNAQGNHDAPPRTFTLGIRFGR